VFDPSLLEWIRAGALPGKEAVTLNEAMRALIEAVREPQKSAR
jgi:hypothetical protein